MSGGHFDYIQYRFTDVIEDIELAIKNNDIDNEYGRAYNFSEATLKEFKNGIKAIRKAQIYIQRIDWLISGDDGENSFHERLKEELAANR